jgi:hypothetical protein
MFRVIIFLGGLGGRASSSASPVWVDASRGGSDAGRDTARGIRADRGAFLIYDAS